jgi:MtN3 and saliva related transmembrane protein
MNYITIIGLIAATLTTVSFLPQVIHTWKTKQTHDISLVMYTIITTGVFMWLVYGLLIGDLPIIAANIVTFILAGSVLILKLKYG